MVMHDAIYLLENMFMCALSFLKKWIPTYASEKFAVPT